MSIHTKKYEQAILYLCFKLGKEIRGKKKLAKLLYFADFDFFEKNQKSITGDAYKALPMGPFPVSLDAITKKMEKQKLISIENIEEHDGYIPTEIYKCTGDLDVSIFSEEEMKILNRVIKKYGNLNGKQLEDLTHAEAPYIGTEPKKIIPYELSYYRGTDFSENA